MYRTVMPGCDNRAPRQDNAFALENATPGAYQAWLETAINETKRDLQGTDRLVFINAWNEWAEGLTWSRTDDSGTPSWKRSETRAT